MNFWRRISQTVCRDGRLRRTSNGSAPANRLTGFIALAPPRGFSNARAARRPAPKKVNGISVRGADQVGARVELITLLETRPAAPESIRSPCKSAMDTAARCRSGTDSVASSEGVTGVVSFGRMQTPRERPSRGLRFLPPCDDQRWPDCKKSHRPNDVVRSFRRGFTPPSARLVAWRNFELPGMPCLTGLLRTGMFRASDVQNKGRFRMWRSSSEYRSSRRWLNRNWHSFRCS